jgi:hypothetical protein
LEKRKLSSIINDPIGESSNEADRTIDRLIQSGKLIQTPRASFETDNTLILGG